MKKITIKDIAKEANVSIATVSNVINNKSKGVSKETREKILNLVERYDYKPNAVARGLVKRRTNTIGLVIPDIRNPFYPMMAKGVEEVALENGYSIFLCDGSNSSEREAQYFRILQENLVSGVIYNNFNDMAGKTLDIMKKSDIPVVFIDNYVDMKGFKCLLIDNKKAMFELVNYCISMGHRRIVFAGGTMDSYTADERYKGYLQALEENMIPVDSNMIMTASYRAEDGYAMTEELLDRGTDFTAIICHNDYVALGVIQKLQEVGLRIPEDISVTGFDNIDLTRIMTPKLTTINYPVYELAKKAVKHLIDGINKGKVVDDENRIEIMEHQLVIRDSVKRLDE